MLFWNEESEQKEDVNENLISTRRNTIHFHLDCQSRQ